jgi:hypothetical protein
LILRPHKMYYIVLILTVILLCTPLVITFLEGKAFSGIEFYFKLAMFSFIAFISGLMCIFMFSMRIALDGSRIKYHPFLRVGNEIFYSDIKSLDLVLSISNGLVKRPTCHILITGIFEDLNMSLDISMLTKKQKKHLMMLLSERAPKAKLNQLAEEVKNGNFKIFNKKSERIAIVICFVLLTFFLLRFVIK